MKSVGAIVFFVLLCHISMMAQVNPTAGRKLSEMFLQKQAQQTDKAKKYAEDHSTPLSFTDEKGNHILLVDVTSAGLPVYRITLNAGAAVTTGASVVQDPLQSGLKLNGQGMSISVYDAGTVKDHIELGSRLTSKEGNMISDHATHVTGTLIATGINPLAKGMAPQATANTYYFNSDIPVMAALAESAPTELLLSNHSYGAATGWFRSNTGWMWAGDPEISSDEDSHFGFYDQRAAALDEITSQSPYYSIFWAAGNDRIDSGDGSRPADCNGGTGYDCIIPDAVAKNIFTIGAIDKLLNYTSPSSVAMSTYSSWGPTDDGRIKPDLVAAGTELFSLSSAGDNVYESNSGTSMSTPNASGSLLLLQELYKKLHGGFFMKSATLKALAIHTAKEAGPFPGPDYSFGWGVVDVAAASQLMLKEDDVAVRIQELSLNEGEVNDVLLQPKAGKKITVTIAWTDPAATPVGESLDPSNLMLVNDLDVRISDVSGATQSPWILDPLNPSRQAARGDNFRDNIEKIEFSSPQAVDYTMRVSHKGHLKNGRQDYSIIVSYEPVVESVTYYWIGNSGDWNDVSHWSLSTGGSSATTVPGEEDHVIFDENSFSGAGVVSINTATKSNSLLWLASQSASIDLKGNTLIIGAKFKVSSLNQVFKNGTVEFSSVSTGTISWQSDATQDVTATVSAGSWILTGDLNVKALEVSGGALHVMGSHLQVETMVVNSEEQKTLDLHGATIALTDTWTMTSNNLVLGSENSSLKITSAGVVADWQNIQWSGTIEIGNGDFNLLGSNTIQNLSVRGKCILNDPNAIDRFTVFPGATLDIADGTTQSINSWDLQGPATITSTGHANIQLEERMKYCFDNLIVTSVGVLGTSVVNAGPGSTVTGSPNWLTVECSKMLFANFSLTYSCAGGLGQLNDLSVGEPTSWQWTVNDPSGDVMVYDTNSPQIRLNDEGAYIIKLSVEKDGQSNDVTQSIVVGPNTLATNEIFVNEDSFFSMNDATKFEWYRDGEKIIDATTRRYEYDGQPGVYTVATFDDDCNILSEPLVITGIADEGSSDIFYPNPASVVLHYGRPDVIIQAMAINTMGQEFLLTLNSTTELNVSGLAEGIYVVVLKTEIGTARRKILIRR